MSAIISYPSATPELADLLLGTKYDQENNPTRNFQVDSLRYLIANNTTIDLQFIMEATTDEDTIALIEEAVIVPIGNAQTTNEVSLNSSGVFTFNEHATIQMRVVVNFGAEDYEKTANRYVLFAPYLNDVQYGPAEVCVINRSSRYITKEYNYLLEVNDGDTMYFQLAAAEGETGGGVVAFNSATPFNNIPAISVYIHKLRLL
jgi:hypothetical protein